VPGRYVVLGTDGYGRSDAREALRHHFEVDRRFIALATLRALADEGKLGLDVVQRAIVALGIDAAKPNPLNS
jgi:pyruvate dehydrogenase E1 component